MTLPRLTPAQWRFAGGIAILIGCACAPPRPAAPSRPIDRRGNWSGQTSQGGAITFTISSTQRITALAVDYNFAGCAGGVTMTPDVAVDTTGFASALVVYTPNGPAGPSRIVVHLAFPTATTANITLDFIEFPVCGTSHAWTTARR